MSEIIQSIKIQYDNSDDAMYGDIEMSKIDTVASEHNFEELLNAALIRRYPNTEITIETGNGRYMVDGDTAHPEVDTIQAVLHDVWSSFKWLAEK